MSAPYSIHPTADEVIEDPHRRDEVQAYWAFHRGILFHRREGELGWDRVRRISFTPARILAIASLIAQHEGTLNES